MRWTITTRDKEQLEALMQAAMDAFSEEVPRLDPQPESQKDYSETLSLYPIFDMHRAQWRISMNAARTGIQQQQSANNFIDYSIQCAPDSEKAVLLIGGDMLHSDGTEAVTPASGHVLDQDSRYAKLVYVAIRSVRRAIAKLLSKHKTRWTITTRDKEQLEALMQAAMDAFSEEVPRLDPQPESQKDYSETLSLYPIFDMHRAQWRISMNAARTGIQQQQSANNFIDYSIQCAPDSEKAVLLIGGDMLHSDGTEAVTPASGHVLDQDSRYAKLVYVAIRSVRRAIAKLLSKHKTIWLRAAMAAAYENEPRVHVDVSPRVVHHTQYGKTFPHTIIWLRAAMAAAYENEPRVHVDVSPRVVHHTQYGKTFPHTIMGTLSANLKHWRQRCIRCARVHSTI
ncbi:UNVERIFIED_ASMBLY: putative phosphoesterase [Shigella phage 2019SD1]|uniref:Phosphoesterase n=1 Tax=Shigella phage 2019SD1 TaxID=2848074 RepID=A0A6M5CCK3_9CAUD|nr:DNA repair exonuclease [Shigella phage 2019SD1]